MTTLRSGIEQGLCGLLYHHTMSKFLCSFLRVPHVSTVRHKKIKLTL